MARSAEIGAGQEVVRHFFKLKLPLVPLPSISAYDMKFSDEIYGKADRYVSRGRLVQMLEHEYSLLDQRLTEVRGDHSTFFAFANTVAAQSFSWRTGVPRLDGYTLSFIQERLLVT